MKALNLTDGYKVGHAPMFPEGTSLVFNNMTSRSSRIPGVDYNIFFGLKYYIKRYLIKEWNESFFGVPKADAVAAYKKRIDAYLGPDKVSMKHIEELHDLGYLPITIMALPEGSKVRTKVPFLVTYNTHPSAYWLPNYLETLMSVTLWPMITSATTAFRYRQILEGAAEMSGGDKFFVKFQGHDFSMRGMFGVEAAIMSGAAHLTSFLGTDTFAALDFCDEYYGGADGYSVPATEHAVCCLASTDYAEEVLEVEEEYDEASGQWKWVRDLPALPKVV